MSNEDELNRQDRVDIAAADALLDELMFPMVVLALKDSELEQLRNGLLRIAADSIRELRSQGYTWTRIAALAGTTPHEARRVARENAQAAPEG